MRWAPTKADMEMPERLKAVGLSGAGAAHDINNLLGVVLGYCEELLRGDHIPQPARLLIAEIAVAGSAARDVAKGLLAITGGSPAPAEVLDVNSCVRRMHSMLTRLMGEQVIWTERLGVDLGAIALPPGQMEQLLMNLVINARDAMPDGGRLCIETAHVCCKESDAQWHAGLQPGNYVRLSLGDTGAGMHAEVQSRMFDPFFTTKATGRGSGLGLSTVSTIVRGSGGHIAVHSQPGCGSTFHLYFPVVPRPMTAKPRRSAGQHAQTILLVDDCFSLRTLVARVLTEAGYRVLEACGAEEAFVLAEDTPVSLVISDLMLPDSSGPEFVARLTSTRPDIMILFTSGDPRCVARLGAPHLEKPFTREKLLEMVGEILDPASKSTQDVPGAVKCSPRKPAVGVVRRSQGNAAALMSS